MMGGGGDCAAIMTAIKMVANPLTEHFNNLACWLSGGENCTKCTWTEQWLRNVPYKETRKQQQHNRHRNSLQMRPYQIKENLLNKLNACIKESRLRMGGGKHI